METDREVELFRQAIEMKENDAKESTKLLDDFTQLTLNRSRREQSLMESLRKLQQVGHENFHLFVLQITPRSENLCAAIIWADAGLLSIGCIGTYFSEIWFKIHQFSLKKMHLKMPAILSRPQYVNSLRLLRLSGA